MYELILTCFMKLGYRNYQKLLKMIDGNYKYMRFGDIEIYQIGGRQYIATLGATVR